MEFVVSTDSGANILEVIHASQEASEFLKPGINLLQLLEHGSKEKFSRFYQKIFQYEKADGWEVFFEIDQDAQYQILSGMRNQGGVCVAGAENRETLRQIMEHFWCSGNLQQKSNQQSAEYITAQASPARPDQELFDDIGRLYSEMATLQRELSKKKVDLEQSNKIINDYAANLEGMVAEKTQELRASESKFRGVFENSSLGIAIADIDGNIITCNNALIEVIGDSKQKICQYTIPDIFFKEHPSRFPDIMNDLRVQNHTKEIEKEFCRVDGDQKFVNINIYTLKLREENEPNIIYIIEDITRRKLNEQALLQSEKLSAVGKLAASLAHEINNPLQSIIGFLGLAAESLENDSQIGEYIDIALSELDRIKNIVTDLRAASRKPQIKEKKPADLYQVIQRVVNLTRKKADENRIEITIQSMNDLPLVRMDQEQIHQVLLNLVINSIEAIAENGSINISTVVLKPEHAVQVRIIDDGPGIATDVIDKLFQPFFTTKQEGLGLGLHLSKAIMDVHNGEIKAANHKKGGAIFSISLPIA